MEHIELKLFFEIPFCFVCFQLNKELFLCLGYQNVSAANLYFSKLLCLQISGKVILV